MMPKSPLLRVRHGRPNESNAHRTTTHHPTSFYLVTVVESETKKCIRRPNDECRMDRHYGQGGERSG
jgi:hypothetical protein